MGEVAIKVEGLTKQYQIGVTRPRPDTLRDQLVDSLRSLTQWNGRAKSDARQFWALQDVSFEVKWGEVLGVIGLNGAGKSTLLKILSRITEPTSGYADIYGRVGSLLEVGTGFHPELSGRENIYLNAAILGMRRAEIDRKFEEIVDFSGIEEFIDTPVKRYSSGMYVRLAFSVAAHLEPEILIVDEVLAVGDASFQQKCLGKMEQVSRGGRTVLIVSHNMPLIEALCQRAILLCGGKIVNHGDVQRVVESYAGMISERARIPIHERKDRLGEGKIIVSAIELLDANRNLIPTAISGRETIIRLHYRCQTEKIHQRCRVSVSVNGRKGQDLFVLSTDLVDATPLTLAGEGYVDFVIPELPLTGGTYYFQSHIETNGEGQDWIKNVAPLNVADGDFYGTGKVSPPGWQGVGVLIRYHWNVVSSGSKPR